MTSNHSFSRWILSKRLLVHFFYQVNGKTFFYLDQCHNVDNSCLNICRILLPKLTQLFVPTSICQWINSFLTDRQQLVKLGKYTSNTRTISTGAPQGCVLFSLYTNNYTSKDPSVKILKFADDTTLIGLIQDGDESAYRQEVKELAVWCSLNNLELNTLKTVEMIVDFRRNPLLFPHSPSWTALWLQWSHSDSWAAPSLSTWSGTFTLTLLWKRPSRGCTSLRKLNLPQELLKQFYSTIIESVRCTSITVWFSSNTKSDQRRLQSRDVHFKRLTVNRPIRILTD